MAKNSLRKIIDEAFAPRMGDEVEDEEKEEALLVEKNEDFNIPEGHGRSRLRPKFGSSLADTDARYKGVKVSRRSLTSDQTHEPFYGSVDEREHSQAELGHMFDLDDSEDDEHDGESDSENEQDLLTDDDDEEEDDGDQDGDMFSYADEGEEEDDDVDDDDDEAIVTDSSHLVEKGEAIKRQLQLWDKLLEIRIHMQKVLTKINQFPRFDTWKSFQAQGDDKYKMGVKKAKGSSKELLDELMSLQSLAIKSTKGIKRENCSDSEGEPMNIEPSIKKRKISDYTVLAKNYHDCMDEYRTAVIDKWNDRTQIMSSNASKKSFSGFETSVLKQIEHILADKSRLISRTHMRRTVYRILGTSDSSDSDGVTKIENPEIFDDDDFYHQLLKDLIERKSEHITDPTQLGKHWARLQRLRTKAKKDVDTKASKGRKTRYDIHAKLVNFMAPVDHHNLTDNAKNILFSSLFSS